MRVQHAHRRAGALVLGLLCGGALLAPPASAHHEAPTPVEAGPRSAISPVHPPDGSPIDDVARDCGFSVELRDGNALWVFCDSTDASPTTAGTWFLNNTAAIARPDGPTTMLEPLSPIGEPYQFIGPTAYNPCGNDPHIIWPSAGVVVPAGARDRVIVYYENACLVGANNISGVETHSIGVAEFVYDPQRDPLAEPIRATVRNPMLWADEWQFGRAAVHRDGWVYAYQCDWEWGDPWGCRVARVAAAVVQDPGMYEYWDGEAWVPHRQAAEYLTLVGDDGPGVGYQVVWLEEFDAYAMTYIGWPGIGAHQKVRFAHRPMGPWTPPMTIELPGCSNDPWWCYAGGIHTQLTTDAHLGLTYFDPLVPFPDRPANGQVMAYTQPVALVPPAAHRFEDVWPDHPFFAEIEWLAEVGITDGFADGTFGPTLPITREGFAAFLHRAAGAPAGPYPDPGFTDVAPDHPFHLEIAWMAATGLAEGTPSGSFEPTSGLTRQAMAAFLHRLAGAPSGPFPDPGFSDVAPDHPFHLEIAWMAATGRSLGFADGTYRPDDTVSRQETAAFLSRSAG